MFTIGALAFNEKGNTILNLMEGSPASLIIQTKGE